MSKYVVMNRFPVRQEHAENFVQIWRDRQSDLPGQKGFIDFQFFRLDQDFEEGVILFASYTLWEDKESFEAWTRSEDFEKAHAVKKSYPGGVTPKQMMVRGPKLEQFEQILDK